MSETFGRSDEAPQSSARELALLSAKNERLAEALRAARDQILDLKRQIDDLAKPPGTYAVFLARAHGRHPA